MSQEVTVAGNFTSTKTQFWLAIGFMPFTVLALWLASPYFSGSYFNAESIAAIMALGYFMVMYRASGEHLRRLMLVMVPLSYLGELIFCKLLGMYSYHNEAIPLYVPLGHSIVYASGYIVAYTPFAKAKDKPLRYFFAVAFALLFIGVGTFLNDLFSVFSGVLFFVLLYRKQWQNLYFFIALCVIFIELVGTLFKCWVWQPEIFGVLPAANPPMGAVFFYAGGDVLLAKIVGIWEKRKIKNTI